MYCRFASCHREIADDAVFCPYCGRRQEPETEAGIRTIPLLDCLAEKLSPHLVFPDPEKGGIITDSRFQIWGRNYQKQSGATISPYQLRHGFATMLSEVGISAKDAQAILGHSSIDMTWTFTQRYVHSGSR